MNTPSFRKPSHSTPTCIEDGTERESVPKRRHIKFKRRGITQKKAENNENLTRISQHMNLFICVYFCQNCPVNFKTLAGFARCYFELHFEREVVKCSTYQTLFQ